MERFCFVFSQRACLNLLEPELFCISIVELSCFARSSQLAGISFFLSSFFLFFKKKREERRRRKKKEEEEEEEEEDIL